MTWHGTSSTLWVEARTTRKTPRVAALVAGLAVCAAHAFAQQTTPFDIGSVGSGQPAAGRIVPPAQPSDPQETQDTQAQEAPQAFEDTSGATYRVARFVPEFVSEHPQHPDPEGLLDAEVTLALTPDGFDMVTPGARTTTMRLRDITPANAGAFTPGALSAVGRALVKELSARGVSGVVVQLHPDDIDGSTGQDKRAQGLSDLRMQIITGVVSTVRTISSGRRLEGRIERGELDRVDSEDRVSKRLREHSPVLAGDVFNAQAADDYAFRLNRHPGRQVGVAIAPGAGEREIALDYLTFEDKPWTITGSISNTGTKSTSDWRQRIGFQHNQLTGHDDVLKLDFVTAGLDNANSLDASYEFPVYDENLRARVYARWNEFDASAFALGDERFTGQSYRFGAEAIYNVYQQKQLFIDLVGGVRWDSVKVTNTLFAEQGSETFLTPYFGARLEKITGVSQTFADLSLEYQGITNVSLTEIQQLGRTRVDDDWEILKLSATHQFYLEPFFSDVFMGKGTKGSTSLAHQIALNLRGQYAFNRRLIPQEQDVVGGMFSVRGYDESILAGDSAIVMSIEYRYHIPQAFATSPPGTLNGKKMGYFGDDFRWAPSEAFGRADWDLIGKAFLDVGITDTSAPSAGEKGVTIAGVGLGMELQYKTNVSLRADWGFALSDVNDAGVNVSAGDNKVHFMVSVQY